MVSKRRIDRIPRCAGTFIDNHPLLAQQPIHNRGLADIGPSQDRDADCRIVLVRRRPMRDPANDLIEEIPQATAFHRRHADRNPTQAEGGKLRRRRLHPLRINLVRDEQTVRCLAQKLGGDFLVMRLDPLTCIDHEKDQIALIEGVKNLVEDPAVHTDPSLRNPSARVDKVEAVARPLNGPVETIPGDSRRIVDHCEGTPENPVEQGRLAHVRAPNDRNDR